jgi:FixJ family two-component response regulator
MASSKLSGTVFVVDDEAPVRRALARLLLSAGYTVETFASAREFLDRQPGGAGCLLLDMSMPGLSGLELQQALQAVAPPPPIIFLTGHGDVTSSVRAMKGGAVDFLTKPVCERDLLPAIALAMERGQAAQARHAEWLALRQRADTLTVRELEVMRLVVRGWLNKQVAIELGTVEKTIKVHRARLIEKMGVSSLAELVRAAEKLGMFSQEATGPGSERNAPTANRQPPRKFPTASARLLRT